MSLQRKIQNRRKRRALRVRAKFDSAGIRISVFRSLQHVYVQVIDDAKHTTVASCSSRDAAVPQTVSKKERAFAVGKIVAQRARELGVTVAVFDRGSFLYHGRVKAVAEGLRDGGLQV